jgi:hypothetical protein
MADAGDKAVYLDIAFWPMAAMVLTLSVKSISWTSLDRYFRFVLAYTFVSTSIEVLLFLAVGRLPAMGFEDSFFVRFGGFLDDPNGFAPILYMLMGWSYYRFSGKKCFFIETALLICILLTQSLTAIGFLVLFVLCLMTYNFFRRPVILLLLCFCVGVAFSFVWSPIAKFVSFALETRSGSVNDHVSQVTNTSLGRGIDWIFGSSSYSGYESWWVGSLVSFGIPWCLLTLGLTTILVSTVFREFQRARKDQEKAIMAGILSLACYFFVGNINLPYFKIFPANFLFFFFSFLVFFGRLDGTKASLASSVSLKSKSNELLFDALP